MYLAIILILIPLFFSLVSFLAGKKYAPFVALASGVVSLFYFLLLMGIHSKGEGYIAMYTLQEWLPQLRLHFHVGIDAASIVPLMLTQLVVSLSVLATMVKGNQRSAGYYALIGLTHAALNGFFCAQNPMTFFIFFELALLPVYFLVLQNGGPNRKQAVFKFFLYTAFGGLLMLSAILFLQYNMASDLKLEMWFDYYENRLTVEYQKWLVIAFLIAFAIKSPVFPFHTWQADLYVQADKPVLMIIAGVLSKMGVFGLVRFNFLFVDVLKEWQWQYTLITICLIGVLYGALIAWRQKDIVKILAYSSLSHMCLIAAGIMTLSPIGVQGGIYAMLAHGLAAAGLFFVTDVLIRRTNASAIDSYSGIARISPRFSVYFFILVLSAVGLPLTAGFIGELFTIWAITKMKFSIGILAALSVVFGAIYMLRLFQRTMLGETSSNVQQFEKLSLSEDYIFILLVVLIFALGLFPGDWMGLSMNAYNYMNVNQIIK